MLLNSCIWWETPAQPQLERERTVASNGGSLVITSRTCHTTQKTFSFWGTRIRVLLEAREQKQDARNYRKFSGYLLPKMILIKHKKLHNRFRFLPSRG